MESADLIPLRVSILLIVSLSGTIWHGTARFHGTESGTNGISIRAALRAKSCPMNRAKPCRPVMQNRAAPQIN